MAKQKLIQSAKFKRDYVAAGAVVIFFLIVLSEVALAVSIPAYLHHENAMAFQVRRLQLLRSFDSLRSRVRSHEPKSESAAMELRLMMWNLDLLANYLRENSGKLNDGELTALQNFVTESGRISGAILSGKNLCREQRLDASRYVNQFIPVEKK